MVATTHVDLRLRAKKMGIETRIVHGSSISSAVCGLTGLQNYRFGKSATVAFPYKNIVSETPYDTIKMNKANGLHSLIFLDIDREKGYMTINRGIELLLSVEEKRKEGVLKDAICVGIARAGSPEPCVKAGAIEKLTVIRFRRSPAHHGGACCAAFPGGRGSGRPVLATSLNLVYVSHVRHALDNCRISALCRVGVSVYRRRLHELAHPAWRSFRSRLCRLVILLHCRDRVHLRLSLGIARRHHIHRLCHE